MRPFLALLLCCVCVGCKSPESTAPNTLSRPSDLSVAIKAAETSVETGHLIAAPIDPLPRDVVRGVALPMYSEFPGLSYEQMVARAASLGASHLSLVVTWDQRTIYDNRIRPEPGVSPPDERVTAVIRAAHGAGMKVMLFPIVHVTQRGDGEWRGKMAPTDFARWSSEYSAFIAHYASIAATEKVEIFSVGSELSSMEKHEEFWRELIATTRRTYGGTLIYSSNWDHYTEPKFWDALDFIGVSSYFEVAKRPDEPVFVVSKRWKQQRDTLLEFASQTGKRLVLTEVGYPAVDSASVHPWDYTGASAPNPNQQLAAFRSLVDGWADVTNDHFAGAFVWHVWGWGGLDDTSYNVFSKPSESAVRGWFTTSSSLR